MGDAADDAMDSYYNYLREDFEDDFIFTPRRRKSFQSGSGNYNWKIKGGFIVSMWDMEERHILNAIQICKDYGNTGKQSQLEEVYEIKYNKNPNKQMTHTDFLKRVGDI